MLKSKVKILLINPPPFRRLQYGENNEIITRYWQISNSISLQYGDLYHEPNLGILMLAGFLEKNGFPTKVIDFNLENERRKRLSGKALTWVDVALEMKKYALNFDIIGISVLTMTVPAAKKLVTIIKAVNPKAKILVGGIYPTLNPDAYRTFPRIDAWVVGEGEEFILDYVYQIIRYGEIKEEIQGAVILENNKKIYFQPRPICQDLKSRPNPAYNKIYRKNTYEPKVFRVLTGKGCSKKCGFCSPALALGNQFRKIPLSQIQSNIESILKSFRVTDIVMGDLTFLDDFEHSFAVCKYLGDLRKKRVDISYWCQTSVEKINHESAELLRMSGCKQVAMGIEIANDGILGENGKYISLEDTKGALKVLNDAGVPVQAYLMVGLPGEKREDIFNTIEFTKEQIIDGLIQVANVAVYVPFPGAVDEADVEIVDNYLGNYTMSVFPHMNPFPVYNTSEMSRYEIRAMWELFLAELMAILKKKEGSK